jgi:hypothetical protein
MHWVLPDAQSFVIAPQGESVDFYVGNKNIYTFTLPASMAATMAWWIMRWWVTHCWAGLRLRVWWWLLARGYDEELHAKEKASRIPRNANP